MFDRKETHTIKITNLQLESSNTIFNSSLVLTILNVLFFSYQGLYLGNFIYYGILCFIFQFLIVAVFFLPNIYFHKLERLINETVISSISENSETVISSISENSETVISSISEDQEGLLAKLWALQQDFSYFHAEINKRIEAITSTSVNQHETLNANLQSALESYVILAATLEKETKKMMAKMRAVSKNQEATLGSIGQLDTSIAESSKEISEQIETMSKNQNEYVGAIKSTLGNQLTYVETQLRNQLNSTYARLDALMSLHQMINLNSPLPIMHEWTISSDYGCELIRAVLNKGEGSVIDLGSGVSTLLMGYATQINGSGKVITLEESEEFYEKTRELIIEHELEDYCEVHLCPLKNYKIGGKNWLWYDIKNVNFDKHIALISVDGPRGDIQEMARYPVVPILDKYMDNKTVIFLDDGSRSDEVSIASRWEEEYKLISSKHLSHKGYFRFTKTV